MIQNMATEEEPTLDESEPFVQPDTVLLRCDLDRHIRDGFSKFWSSKRKADVDILCKGECFKAHYIIIASQCGYLERQLNPSIHNGESMTRVTIDADPRILQKCFQFMYTGKTEVHRGQLSDITLLAERLDIKQLYHLCRTVEFRDTVPHPTNCLSMMCTGKAISNEDLVKKAQPLALTYFVTMTNDPSFASICNECVRELLHDDNLSVSDEEQRLTTALAWVQYDLSSRQEYLRELLEGLPLMKMKPWMIESFVNHAALLGQPECQSLLREAVITAQNDPTRDRGSDDEDQEQRCFISMGWRTWGGDSWSDAGNVVTLTNLSADSKCRELTKLPSKVNRDGDIACCVSGGWLYVSCLGESEDECWRFSMVREEWSDHGKLNTGRRGHCMTACGSEIYVLAGRDPSSSVWSCNENVEVYDENRGDWCLDGQLMGDECFTSCCCVHQEQIIVCGVYLRDGDLLLQMFNPTLRRVTSRITIPCTQYADVYGVGISRDDVIMVGREDTYVIPAQSLLLGDASRLTACSTYRSPNTVCVMAVCDDNVLLFGGAPRANNPDHFLYRTSVRNLVQNMGSGWKPITPEWPLGRISTDPGQTLVRPGACCLASIPTK